MGIEIAVTELMHCQTPRGARNRPFAGSLVKHRQNDCYATGVPEWRMPEWPKPVHRKLRSVPVPRTLHKDDMMRIGKLFTRGQRVNPPTTRRALGIDLRPTGQEPDGRLGGLTRHVRDKPLARKPLRRGRRASCASQDSEFAAKAERRDCERQSIHSRIRH